MPCRGQVVPWCRGRRRGNTRPDRLVPGPVRQSPLPRTDRGTVGVERVLAKGGVCTKEDLKDGEGPTTGVPFFPPSSFLLFKGLRKGSESRRKSTALDRSPAILFHPTLEDSLVRSP